MRIHIRKNGHYGCGLKAAKNYIDIDDSSNHGESPWPWIASMDETLRHLCLRCDRRYGDEVRLSFAERTIAKSKIREKIPEKIMLAIRTASGGNRTVIRCNVPGYSSRLSKCMERLCREYRLSKQDVGQMLCDIGILYICGHPIPMQWSDEKSGRRAIRSNT